ncbi:MAG: PHP domain-containing protein, partial [Actinomycetes bacterium]
MRIDLHVHSTASDGTDSPADLLHRVAATGLDVVALTDHDTFAGYEQVRHSVPEGLVLVPGVEISTRRGPATVHLLGYLVDPGDAHLVEALAASRRSRVDRARQIVARLAADGYPVAWEQVLARSGPGGPVGRPHIADVLVVAGSVADRTAAVDGPLRADGPYYVPYDVPDPVDV